MDPALKLLILLAFAFAAVQLEGRIWGARVRFIASTEALLLGVISGPLVLGLLDESGITTLEPLLSVINGFIGFLVGLPLANRPAENVPRPDRVFALVLCVIIAAIVGGISYLAFTLLPWSHTLALPEQLVAAGTLGIGAAVCSVDTVCRGIRERRAAGPVSRILIHSANLSQLLAIIAFGVLLASTRTIHALDEALTPLAWSGLCILAGLGSGLIFHVFVGKEADKSKLFVATIGLVCLASGIAHVLQFSPLFLGLIAGWTVARSSSSAPSLAEAVERLKRPTYTLLLLLAGASWEPLAATDWLFPLAFIALRIVALHVASNLAGRLHDDLEPQTRGLGSGLMAQGALAAAIAVNFSMVEHTRLTGIVTTSLLLSAVAAELWASSMLRKTLQNSGETERHVAPPTVNAPSTLDVEPSR